MSEDQGEFECFDNTLSDNVVCPYCGYEDQDICEYDHSETHITSCNRCCKEFMLEPSISVHFSSWKVPCVNGEGEHKFKNLFTSVYHKTEPRHPWRCTNCNKEEWRDNPDYVKPE